MREHVLQVSQAQTGQTTHLGLHTQTGHPVVVPQANGNVLASY